MNTDLNISITQIGGCYYYSLEDAANAFEYPCISEAAKLIPNKDMYQVSLLNNKECNLFRVITIHGLEILIRNAPNKLVFRDKDMVIRQITPTIPENHFLSGIIRIIPVTTTINVEVFHTDESSDAVYTVSAIAAEYGWTPRQMNNFLYENGVQYKISNRWQISRKYAKKGLIVYKYRYSHMQWTENGKAFIEKLMKENGYGKLNRYDTNTSI